MAHLHLTADPGFLRSITLIPAFFLFTILPAQVTALEEFETSEGWSLNVSDGVTLSLSNEKGVTGNAIRIDYDFTKGTGYGGIQKLYPIDLPDNYEFTFYLKAESPANNFEIKFIDSTGNNVWWVNNRNYSFPKEWKKIRIKKRHISFAWGPADDRELRRIDRIEFTVASFVGGKGTVWIDDLRFEPLPPETTVYPIPHVRASSSVRKHAPALITDQSENTYWLSRRKKGQEIVFDFRGNREFGGLQIDWLTGYHASEYDILLSDDGDRWERVFSVKSNQSDVSFVRLPETETKFMKIKLGKSINDKAFGISEVRFIEAAGSQTMNDFIIYAAENSPAGNYPRYFKRQASYWTVTGVNNDIKEALLSEDGMVEVDKALFSIEPMIKTNGKLYNWSNVQPVQSMGTLSGGEGFAFIPSVTWHCGDLKFTTGVSAYGEANKNSHLAIRYEFENPTDNTIDFELYLLIRPFQVNPYYQALNLAGGVGKIKSISESGEKYIIVDNKVVLPQRQYDAFGAADFNTGNIVDMIRSGSFPEKTSAYDQDGMASGIMKYSLKLDRGEKTGFFVVVPFHDIDPVTNRLDNKFVAAEFSRSTTFWNSKVSHIKFILPPSADRLINTYKSMLVYILVNRDRAGIQPGSRSYERSWIRDGSLTSSALLKSGIVKEVRDFIDWYAGHQYENGKVPCVVDFRGPDPVPEHDSHGQLIFLIKEYFNFTHDTLFLRSRNINVLKAVDYIESLIAERSTDHFRMGNDSVRAYYGLVPESISHEGYSAKPMHSYWDNFFIMKGLKDAAEIQRILGKYADYERIARIRDEFRKNLYHSIDLAMKVRKIDYIPGCVELGDFDATSTTIALNPCNELNNLPKPQTYNTFEKYYNFFRDRRDGNIEWINYTPYENRLIGSFIMLDQPERAHELIEYFLDDQRPQGWYHWAEVVWNDYRRPEFIGDMPHTWCGSDFINAVRSMFVYENEYDQSLVLAPALYQEWIDAPGGMAVQNMPTWYGEISYSITKTGNSYHFSISGDLNLPANGIEIRNFNGSSLPVRVTVNGKEISDYSSNKIRVRVMPADVIISY